MTKKYRVVRYELGWDYVAALRFPFLRGPSSKAKQKLVLRAQDGFFRTMPLLTKASFRRRVTARKKRSLVDCALLLRRDSVGIRTQDPQLRRLLLYPAELPNRSVLLSGVSGADSKSGCKYSGFC